MVIVQHFSGTNFRNYIQLFNQTQTSDFIMSIAIKTSHRISTSPGGCYSSQFLFPILFFFFFFFFLFSFISYSLVLHFTTPFIEVLLFGSPSGIAFPQVYRRAYDSPTASTCEPNNCKNPEDFGIQDFKLVLPTALSKFESRTYMKIHIPKLFFFFFFFFLFSEITLLFILQPLKQRSFLRKEPAQAAPSRSVPKV